MLFFLKVLLRSQKAAIAAFVLILSFSSSPWLFVEHLIVLALIIFVLMRFGLVAVGFLVFIVSIWYQFPMPPDASAWYFPYGFAALAIFAIIVLYAFRTSLGGRPLLAPSRLDD